MFLPWTDKKKTSKYHGKDMGSIHITPKEYEKHEEIVKDTVHTEPPHDRNTTCINFNEGSLVLMWDKIKKPIYDQEENNSCFGPYIIRNKSDKERYYLTTLYRRKMPLLVDGSLLQPHIQVT
jgi:hypothetical protein